MVNPLNHNLDSTSTQCEYMQDLISETVAYCYTSIVRNSSCCLDSLYAPGVRKTVLRRVGVGWWCGKSCYDDKKGYRGVSCLQSTHATFHARSAS